MSGCDAFSAGLWQGLLSGAQERLRNQLGLLAEHDGPFEGEKLLGQPAGEETLYSSGDLG